jgi:hypothetical protein
MTDRRRASELDEVLEGSADTIVPAHSDVALPLQLSLESRR